MSQHGIRFNLTPLSFAEEFREMREREGGAWVFTSATLSSAGRFDLFKQRLGIGRYVEKHVGEPLQLLGTGVLLSAADAAAREQHGGAHAQRH